MSSTISGRLSEASVGITEYVRPGDGFTAVLKARYADFQVNEIDKNGAVAELSDLKEPKRPHQNPTLTEDGDASNDLPPETLSALRDLSAKDANGQHFQIDASDMTKEERTQLYAGVKKHFGDRIIGSTVNEGDKKLLKFSKRTQGVRVDNRKKWEWEGDFVHFVVYKENCDTMEAASRIAENLHMKHVKPAFFGYCGTKDKRAKTSQWFSIRRVEPRKIINGCCRLRNITVGNFKFEKHHLKLGDLNGNRFRIALRNVVEDIDKIEDALDSMKKTGFINYFGLQRFGSRINAPTFQIGKHLLLGNFKEAVDLILAPQGTHAHVFQKYLDSHDAKSALAGLKYIPKTIEMKLLLALRDESSNKSPSKYLNALNKLPRNTRLIYLHSYQSWIWNQCASERLKKFGLKCQPGDLVLLTPSPVDTSCMEDLDSISMEETQPDDAQSLELEDLPTQDQKTKVYSLTEEDVAGERYSIYDVVLPLPGFNIDYPNNMKQFYDDLLAEDNLTSDLKQKLKSYSLGGAYRHMLVKPTNFSWEFLKYSDPYCDLILSDFDKLKKAPKIPSVQDGKFTALVLTFDLPSSTYATMALREITKMDTSCEVQAQNNAYHESKLALEKCASKRGNTPLENVEVKKVKVDDL